MPYADRVRQRRRPSAAAFRRRRLLLRLDLRRQPSRKCVGTPQPGAEPAVLAVHRRPARTARASSRGAAAAQDGTAGEASAHLHRDTPRLGVLGERGVDRAGVQRHRSRLERADEAEAARSSAPGCHALEPLLHRPRLARLEDASLAATIASGASAAARAPADADAAALAERILNSGRPWLLLRRPRYLRGPTTARRWRRRASSSRTRRCARATRGTRRRATSSTPRARPPPSVARGGGAVAAARADHRRRAAHRVAERMRLVSSEQQGEPQGAGGSRRRRRGSLPPVGARSPSPRRATRCARAAPALRALGVAQPARVCAAAHRGALHARPRGEPRGARARDADSPRRRASPRCR